MSNVPRAGGAGPARLVSAWFMIYGASFFVMRAIPATGDGFTRGMNRAVPTLVLQFCALGVAIFAARAAARGKRNGARNASWGFAPLVIQLTIGAAIAWLLLPR